MKSWTDAATWDWEGDIYGEVIIPDRMKICQ